MVRIILKLLVEVLGKKLIKAGLEEELLKNQKYITAAKMVWNVIEENFRISEAIQGKIASKADEFDKMLLDKFPELTQSDIAELRQAVAGEINAGKDVVLSQVDALKQLQDINTKVVAENASLKEQLAKVESIFGTKDNNNQSTDNNQVSVAPTSDTGNITQNTNSNQSASIQTNNVINPGQITLQVTV